jgi:hypothetical protein
MRRASILLWIVLAAALAGCGGDAPEVEAESNTAAATVESADLASRAASITKAMNADPDAVEAILESHGVTPDEFEQMMYEIAADPELSKAYDSALAE